MLNKKYQVFYWLKKENGEYLRHMFVSARSQKEAIKICRDEVYRRTGRHAFKVTTKPPVSDRYIDA